VKRRDRIALTERRDRIEPGSLGVVERDDASRSVVLVRWDCGVREYVPRAQVCPAGEEAPAAPTYDEHVIDPMAPTYTNFRLTPRGIHSGIKFAEETPRQTDLAQSGDRGGIRPGLPGATPGGPARGEGSVVAPSPARPRIHEWSKTEIVDALRRHAVDGVAPSSKKWRKRGVDHPASRTVIDIFGSWVAATDAAGLERCRPPGRSNEEMLDAIRRWVATYGAPPKITDWSPREARRIGREDVALRCEAGDWPTSGSVCKRFGSWRAAIAAAGFVPRPPGERRPPVEVPNG
jgi:hypothetical protein